jgi:hypothetical protein
MSSPNGSPYPNILDVFLGISSTIVVVYWAVYKINKCIKDRRICAKMRQILPVVLEPDIPHATFQVDAEVTTELGDGTAIYIEAEKDNIVNNPPFISDVIECIESEIQPVTVAVQIN